MTDRSDENDNTTSNRVSRRSYMMLSALVAAPVTTTAATEIGKAAPEDGYGNGKFGGCGYGDGQSGGFGCGDTEDTTAIGYGEAGYGEYGYGGVTT